MKKIISQLTLLFALLLILPSASLARGSCGDIFSQTGKATTRAFEGDNGWKLVRVTLQRGADGESLRLVTIENIPGASPMVRKNYVFTPDLRRAKATLGSQEHIVTKTDLSLHGDVLVLEADGLRFQLTLLPRGEVRLGTTLISSGMPLPDALLRPVSR